jgi:fused signal recognition particle receptor
MNELAKIKRIIAKKLGADATTTLLVLDSMLGQNSFSQAQIFHEQLAIDGIILTKLDGAAKGGIIFAIIQELQLPIAYITYGIGLQDIAPFDAQQFVDKFLT